MRLAIALDHQVRRVVLADLAAAPASPKDIAEAHGLSLGVVSYHVRALRDAKLVQVAKTERRRGATKTTYQLAARYSLIADARELGRQALELAEALERQR